MKKEISRLGDEECLLGRESVLRSLRKDSNESELSNGALSQFGSVSLKDDLRP